MPQSGYTTIQHYKSTTPGAAPSASNLTDGELGFNISDADMALYAKNASGNVKRIINNPAGLKYPTADGSAANQVLKTDGSGTLAFYALTASRALVSDGSGGLGVSATTSTELGYVSGVTSAIQTQLNAKVAAVSSTDNAIVRFDGTSGAVQNSVCFIDDSGNLGVGTSSPGNRLDVVGRARVLYDTGSTNTGDQTVTTVGAITSGAYSSSYGAGLQFQVNNSSGGFAGGRIVSRLGADNNTADLVFQVRNYGYTDNMTLDASGNLGLGVTPSAWGANNPAIQMGGGNQSSFIGLNAAAFGLNAYFDGTNWRYLQTGGAAALYSQNYAGGHTWRTAPSGTAGNPITFTQAMTLDASGNLLVGTTSAHGFGRISTVVGSGANGLGVNQTDTGNSWSCLYLNRTGSDGREIEFNRNGTFVGSVSVTASATAYNTSSDYRLKENIQPMQNALGVVAQLNPVTYTWKVDGSDGQGFIAHELQAVVPDCVTGEKDAVDAEGKPVYQGVDTSFLVATLTAAIQEQQAMITELKARIEQLEAK